MDAANGSAQDALSKYRSSNRVESPRRQIAWFWGLTALIVLPCLTSVGFRMAGDRAQAAVETRERTSLVFTQYAVNLGEVPPSRRVQARFSFRNTGRETVKITKLEASCGCLQPQLDDKHRELAPGEKGVFFLQVDTALQKSGVQKYWVTVHYTDPQPRTERVLFQIELPERRVTVTPRALVFYQFNERPTEQEIRVSDFREHPLTVHDVTCDSPFVTVKVGNTVKGEDGGQHTILHVVVAGNVPEGMQETTIRIATSDGKYKGLAVPLRIVGPQPVTQPVP